MFDHDQNYFNELKQKSIEDECISITKLKAHLSKSNDTTKTDETAGSHCNLTVK